MTNTSDPTYLEQFERFMREGGNMPIVPTKEDLEAIWNNGGVTDPDHFLGWLPEHEIIVPKVREYEPPEVKKRAGLVAVPRRGPPGSPRRPNKKERASQAKKETAV